MPQRILWTSDSIYNMPDLLAQVDAALGSKSIRATYGGNTIAGGLLELADETQAYISGQWVVRSRGLIFDELWGMVFEFGRNDANNANPAETKAEFRKAYDKVLSQGYKYFSRVVAGTPVPKALDALTDWDLGTDTFNTASWLAEVNAAVNKYNARFVDNYTDFQALKTAGTYTVAQLMRDAYHPTYTTGSTLIGAKLITKLQDATAPTVAAPEITGRVVNYLFGQPTAGSWAMSANASNIFQLEILGRIADLPDQGLVANATGAKVSFPTTTFNAGGQVWAHLFMRNGAGGTVDFYVDRGTGSEKKLSINTAWVYEHYPQGFLIGGNLGAGAHTIEAETTSGNRVTIIGVTCVGAV